MVSQNIIIQMFLCEKTKELNQLAKSVTVTKREIGDLIWGSINERYPYLYFRQIIEHVPEYLELGNENHKEIRENGVGKLSKGAQKAVNKLAEIFKQRRHLCMHLFKSKSCKKWWLIYFDSRDVDNQNNHWVEGAHIHMIASMSNPHMNPDKILIEAKNNPKIKLGSKLHIKYKDSI